LFLKDQKTNGQAILSVGTYNEQKQFFLDRRAK